MRFSVWPSMSQPWADVLDVVTHAERTGWDRAYVADHFMPDGQTADDAELSPMLEATAALAGLATVTERIGLATLVFGVTYRHPAVLAKWAATVDHLSGGRLVLGLGAGWQENEHEQYGIELGRPGVRVDRFAEALAVIDGLLSSRETTVEGDYYRLARALAEPKPVQAAVPLLIGGRGDRMMRLIARYADEWNMWSLPAALAERRAVLDRACEQRNRDPGEIATSTQALWFFASTAAEGDELVTRSGARAAIGGPADRLAEHVAAWQAVGATEIIVPDFTLGRGSERRDRLDTIIEQIAPSFRA